MAGSNKLEDIANEIESLETVKAQMIVNALNGEGSVEAMLALKVEEDRLANEFISEMFPDGFDDDDEQD